MASQLTGTLAEETRRQVGTHIINEFLTLGTAFLRAGDIAAVMEEVERAREQFAKYGLNAAEFIERSR